jgi:hypothetical protein
MITRLPVAPAGPKGRVAGRAAAIQTLVFGIQKEAAKPPELRYTHFSISKPTPLVHWCNGGFLPAYYSKEQLPARRQRAATKLS